MLCETRRIAELYADESVRGEGEGEGEASSAIQPRLAVSGDGCVAVALGASVALVERGTLCVARELITLGAASSCAGDETGIVAARRPRVQTCVWSRDGDVLGIVANDGSACIVSRDGTVNMYISARRTERPQLSILGSFFGGVGVGVGAHRTNGRDIVIGVPASEGSLLTVQRDGKLSIHHNENQSEVVDELDGVSVVAAASNGGVLAVLLAHREKQRSTPTASYSVCALRVLSYAPYIQLLGDVQLEGNDIDDAIGGTSGDGGGGAGVGAGAGDESANVTMAVAGNGERVVVCSKTLVCSLAIRATGRVRGLVGVTDDDEAMELVGKVHIGVHDGPASRIASASFWASNTIAVSLHSGHVMALAASSLDVTMRPSRDADSSACVAVASGLKRELLVLSGDELASPLGAAQPASLASTHSGAWHLESRVQRTAVEMLTYHVERSEWEDALQIATEHGLERDDVFVARFDAEMASGSELTSAVLEATLGKIRSIARVASLCTVSVCDSPEEQECLVEFGLRHGARDMAASLDALLSRIRLLQHRERIGTFLEMSHGVWDKDAFFAFRDARIELAASSLARAGQLSTLQVIFHRHAAALMGKELEIVGHVPANIPPDLVLSLVPGVGRSPLPNPQNAERDWVEEEGAAEQLFERVMLLTTDDADAQNGSWALTATEWLSRVSHGGVDTRVIVEDEVASWIAARARSIETSSGRLDLASQTLAHAKLLGVRSELLRRLTVSIDETYAAVYDGGFWKLSLTEYEMMGDFAKFSLLMRDAPATLSNCETVPDVGANVDTDVPVASASAGVVGDDDACGTKSVHALRTRAIPFLRRLELEDDEDAASDGIAEDAGAAMGLAASATAMSAFGSNDFLLRLLVNSMERGEFQFCVDVMKASGADFAGAADTTDHIFRSADEMATVAVACVYASPCSVEGIESALAIVRSIPSLLVSSELLPTVRRATAHAESSAVLTKHGVAVRPLQLDLVFTNVARHDCVESASGADDLDPELEPRVLLKRMLGHVSRAQVREDDWERVWEDIMFMQGEFGPFEALAESEAKTEYVRALLHSGKVALARRHLSFELGSKRHRGASPPDAHDVPLSPEESERVILEVGKAFAASAISLVSDDVQQARELFSLARGSEQARREIDALDALQLTNMMGVEILPVQLAQHSDPTEIVDMILRSAPDAWRRPEQVYEIASLLGVHSPDQQSSIKLLLANALVQRDEFDAASSYVMDMVRAGHEPAWEIAQNLSLCATLEASVRAELASFALKFCPDENLQGLLETWRSVDCKRCEARAASDLDDRFDVASLVSDESAALLPRVLGVENAAIAEPLIALLSSSLRRGTGNSVGGSRRDNDDTGGGGDDDGCTSANASEANHRDSTALRSLGVALLSLREYRSATDALQCLCLVAASAVGGDAASSRSAADVEGALESLAAACHRPASSGRDPSDGDVEAQVLDARLLFHGYRAYLDIYPHIDEEQRLPSSSLLTPRALLSTLRDTYGAELEKSATALGEIQAALAIEGSASTASDVSWICGHASMSALDEASFNEDGELRQAAFAAAAAKLCTREADMSRLVELSANFGVDPSSVHIARLEALLRSRADDSVVRRCVDVALRTLLDDDGGGDDASSAAAALRIVDVVLHKVFLHWGAAGPPKSRLELLYSVLGSSYARIPAHASMAPRFTRYASLVSAVSERVSVFQAVNIIESGMGGSRAGITARLMREVLNPLLGASRESFDDVIAAVTSLSAVYEATGDTELVGTMPAIGNLACCHACKILARATIPEAGPDVHGSSGPPFSHAHSQNQRVGGGSADADAGAFSHRIDANTRWPATLIGAFEEAQAALELAAAEGGDISESRVVEYVILSGPVPSDFCIESGCVPDHRLPAPHTSMMIHVLEWMPLAPPPGCIASVRYMECMLASGAASSFVVPASLRALSEVHRDAEASLSRLCTVFKFHEIWRVAGLLHDASVLEAPPPTAVENAYRAAASTALRADDDTLLDVVRRLVLSLSEPADEAERLAELDGARSIVWEALSGAQSLHEDVHLRVLRELSESIGVGARAASGDDALWGSWALPDGDHSQGELLLHATSEVMGELWMRDPAEFRFSLADLGSAKDATLRFKSVVGHMAAAAELAVMEGVIDLWADKLADSSSTFVECWLAIAHRYLELGAPDGALHLIDERKLVSRDLSEEQRRDAVAAFGDSELRTLAALLLDVDVGIDGAIAVAERGADEMSTAFSALSAEVLALSLLGAADIPPASMPSHAATRALLDALASRSSSDAADASALRILLPAVAAALTQGGLALDAAEMLLGYSSTHPALRTTDAGMYLLERMLRANASLPGAWAASRSMARFARVPASALRLADEVPSRCQCALRELHANW